MSGVMPCLLNRETKLTQRDSPNEEVGPMTTPFHPNAKIISQHQRIKRSK